MVPSVATLSPHSHTHHDLCFIAATGQRGCQYAASPVPLQLACLMDQWQQDTGASLAQRSISPIGAQGDMDVEGYKSPCPWPSTCLRPAELRNTCWCKMLALCAKCPFTKVALMGTEKTLPRVCAGLRMAV